MRWLTTRNSFDQSSRRRNLNAFRYQDGLVSDLWTQTATGPIENIEKSPYIQSYNNYGTNAEHNLINSQRSNSSLCSPQPKSDKFRNIYGHSNSLEKPKHKTSLKKSMECTYELDNSAQSEIYTEKVKRRRNLYDISTITKYKSMFKLQKNQDDELQKKIIVLPQKRNTKSKYSKVDTNFRRTLIK